MTADFVLKLASLNVCMNADTLSLLCGVDEAGRGCWAGPVVAAAVVFRGAAPAGLNDSKQLTARRREALVPLIQANAWWAVGVASEREIEQHNILQATFLAMRRAVARLPELALTQVVVDGNRDPKLIVPASCSVETLVKADALVAEVSAASILAKVHRDRYMVELAKRYPGYGFEVHAGYGVPDHIAALEKLGPCEAHRMTFKPLKKWLEAA
jgi:ribonuclease HII